MTGRRESTEQEDRRGSEVMDGSLSGAVGPSQCDGWSQAEDTSLQHILSLFPTLFQQNPKRPQKPAFPPGVGSLPKSSPSLTEPASRHLKPLRGVKAVSTAPRWAAAGGDGFPWSGRGCPWMPGGSRERPLTSGSCNDRSMVLCESRSKGGGLRRRGTAETRLL